MFKKICSYNQILIFSHTIKYKQEPILHSPTSTSDSYRFHKKCNPAAKVLNSPCAKLKYNNNDKDIKR